MQLYCAQQSYLISCFVPSVTWDDADRLVIEEDTAAKTTVDLQNCCEEMKVEIKSYSHRNINTMGEKHRNAEK